MTRADLIAALEKAEGPSRELDAEIRKHVPGDYLPAFTASLDAALTLVPDRRAWEIKSTYWSADKRPAACVVRPDGVRRYGLGATPAIALCIAALRAMD